MELLSNRTGFNVLSSPRVMALDGKKAEIITGQQLGYFTTTTSTTGTSQNVSFLETGTKLEITPSIKSDGLIMMDIHPEISDGTVTGGLPQKQTTETTTQLIVKDGQTIIIGGLVRNSSGKDVIGFPVLMDLPVIGSFFKQTTLSSDKKEVIVLITPHIVNERYLSEMKDKVGDMEKQRNDQTPQMTLDLVR